MRVTILGGTGRIGRLIVEQALAAGQDLTVLVRDARKLGPIVERVQVELGRITDPAAVGRAIAGADVVISALGPDGNSADQVMALRAGMRTMIDAMREHGVSRIINLSGAAIDAPGDHKPMVDRLASRIVRLVSRHVVAAKQAEFDELLASGLEWVAVRPPARDRWAAHRDLPSGAGCPAPRGADLAGGHRGLHAGAGRRAHVRAGCAVHLLSMTPDRPTAPIHVTGAPGNVGLPLLASRPIGRDDSRLGPYVQGLGSAVL